MRKKSGTRNFLAHEETAHIEYRKKINGGSIYLLGEFNQDQANALFLYHLKI